MFFDQTSPLNSLPEYLHPRDVLRLDGVRIAAQIIHTELFEIHRLLHEISFSEKKPHSHHVFHACWSVVDNAHRLNRFARIYQESGLLKVNSLAHDILHKVEMLRHSHQHIDERVDQALVEHEQVLFGYLSWVARKNVESSEGSIYSLVSGHYPYPNQHFSVLNPAGRELLNTIDLVTIKAMGKNRDKSFVPVELELAAVGLAVKMIVVDIEHFLANFLAKREPSRVREKDILMQADFKMTSNAKCEIQSEPKFLIYKPSIN